MWGPRRSTKWLQKNRQQRWERWVFARFVFSLVFLLCFFHCYIPRFISKQKNQSCEKNLRQVHSGLFFYLFIFFVFFAVPSPPVQKLEENQKNNPVRRILGKSIQDCFLLVYLMFLDVFAVPSPTVQKLEENQKRVLTMKPIQPNMKPTKGFFGKGALNGG